MVELVERVELPMEAIYLADKEQQQDTVERVQEALATMVEGVVLVQEAVVSLVVAAVEVLLLYHPTEVRKMVAVLHLEESHIQTILEEQSDMEPILQETVRHLGMMEEVDTY